jgi:hypothetical protein
MDNPRRDFRPYESVQTAPVWTRRAEADLALRSVRVVLAVWLVFAPVILGYFGTFPAKQDILIGLVTLPLLALGIALNGMRVVLILAGAWLVFSPIFSGMYFGLHAAALNDTIVGVVALGLGIFPLRRMETFDRPIVLSGLVARPRGWHRQRAELTLPEEGVIPAPREAGEVRPAMRHGPAVAHPESAIPAEPRPRQEPFPAPEGAIEPATAARPATVAPAPEQLLEDEPIPTLYPPLEGDEAQP